MVRREVPHSWLVISVPENECEPPRTPGSAWVGGLPIQDSPDFTYPNLDPPYGRLIVSPARPQYTGELTGKTVTIGGVVLREYLLDAGLSYMQSWPTKTLGYLVPKYHLDVIATGPLAGTILSTLCRSR